MLADVRLVHPEAVKELVSNHGEHVLNQDALRSAEPAGLFFRERGGPVARARARDAAQSARRQAGLRQENPDRVNESRASGFARYAPLPSPSLSVHLRRKYWKMLAKQLSKPQLP